MFDKEIRLKAGQIKAARALLDWSQEDLAAATGLSTATIRKIEAGHISPRDSTMGSIAQALILKRIEFIGTSGVRLNENDIIMIESENCYLDLLHDIDKTLKPHDEILFMYADSRLSTEEEIEAEVRLRKKIKWRCLTEEGNTYIHYPLEEWRWLPKKFFRRNINLIYGSRIALGIEMDESRNMTTKIIIVDSAPLARSLRNVFDFMWENCPQPTHSTAPKIYK